MLLSVLIRSEVCTPVGENVVVFTDMKPSGKVKASDGHIYEAALKFGGFASKGETLRVVSAEQGRLYCDR